MGGGRFAAVIRIFNLLNKDNRDPIHILLAAEPMIGTLPYFHVRAALDKITTASFVFPDIMYQHCLRSLKPRHRDVSQRKQLSAETPQV